MKQLFHNKKKAIAVAESMEKCRARTKRAPRRLRKKDRRRTVVWEVWIELTGAALPWSQRRRHFALVVTAHYKIKKYKLSF